MTIATILQADLLTLAQNSGMVATTAKTLTATQVTTLAPMLIELKKVDAMNLQTQAMQAQTMALENLLAAYKVINRIEDDSASS